MNSVVGPPQRETCRRFEYTSDVDIRNSFLLMQLPVSVFSSTKSLLIIVVLIPAAHIPKLQRVSCT